MVAYEYFMFGMSDDPRVGTIEKLDANFDHYWMLTEGTRLGDLYPPKLELNLSRDGGDLITDFIDNIHSVVMLSAKAKVVMEQEGLGPEQVEFLPFTLKDKKRKKVPEPYFIANALESADCFDWDRSVYELYPNKKKVVYSSLRKMHLLLERIPKGARFFRVGELKQKIIIRSDLLEKLKAAGCTGITVLPMGAKLL